jgi:pimeloyl-ACP methyl ester carboxylesterase
MLQHILPVTARRLGLINDASVTMHLEPYPLESVETPALLIGTADDLYGTFDAARLASERIPNARFLSYPTGGHLWVGHHEEVTSAIAAFLTETLRRDPPASSAATEALSPTR